MRVKLSLFATKAEFAKIKKALSGMKGLDIRTEKVSAEVVMRHEAATSEAAEVLRAAGMKGAVILFLDHIE